MIDQSRFEVFTYVAELGGITAAAKHLGLSKASLSKQIKLLEQQFKITLFKRVKQRLKLTPQGEVLFKQCLKLRKNLDEARNICTSFHEEPEGQLHVVAFPYFSQKLIIPKLKSFLSQYPKLMLHLDTTEAVPDFMRQSVDLAVGFSLPVPNPNEVIQKRIATTHYVLCASPQYFNEYGKPNSIEELLTHDYIEHGSRLGYGGPRFKTMPSITLKPKIIVNTVESMISCAKESLGLIQLPYYMVDKLLETGVLESVLDAEQAENAYVYYHYPKLSHMQAKVRKFIEHFL